MNMRALIFIFPLSLLACPRPVTPTPDPGDGGFLEDAGPEAATPRASCSAYCDHARKLGCREGMPTAKGAACETVCENFQKTGYATTDLSCGIRATSCAALSACP